MAATAMRTALLYNAHDLRIEKKPAPAVLTGHVSIQPKFCGLCGSDLHFYFHSEMADSLRTPHPLTGASIPVPFGHEFAGVVKEIGPGCPSNLRVGDRVAVMPTLTDGNCWACENGHTNTCSRLGFLGYHGDAGGLSDHAVVPSKLVFKLPEGVGCDVGALIEPLAVAWHSIKHINPDTLTSSSTVLILGGGAVGSAIILALLARGVTNILVSEPSMEKRALAKALGAKAAVEPSQVSTSVAALASKTGGVDIVFDCAGIAGRTLETAVENVRSQGTIVNLAVQASASIPLLAMTFKEIRLFCSLAYTATDFQEVIQAVGDGKLDPRRMITKRVRLEDVVAEGLESLQKGDVLCKVLVDMEL